MKLDAKTTDHLRDSPWHLLPAEVVNHIFSYLPLQAVANLSLVDRRCQEIAKKHLEERYCPFQLKNGENEFQKLKIFPLFAIKKIDGSLDASAIGLDIDLDIGLNRFIDEYLLHPCSWSEPLDRQKLTSFLKENQAFIAKDPQLAALVAGFVAKVSPSLENPVSSTTLKPSPLSKEFLLQLLKRNGAHLEELNLSGWRGIDASLLEAIAGCKQLKRLNLAGALSGNLIEIEVGYAKRSQSSLGIKENFVERTIAALFALLQNCQQLEALNLTHSIAYFDSLLEALTLFPLKKLKILQIPEACFFDQEPLERLLKGFVSLKQLDIANCSDALYRHLQEQKPSLQINRSSKQH